jgi:hypothetical protein
MFPRKRLLKKEKHVQSKKRLRFFSAIFGMLGLSCIGIGILVLLKEPPYTSPLPIFLPFQADAGNAQSKKELEKALKDADIVYEDLKQVRSGIYSFTIEDNGEVTLTLKKSLSTQLSSLQVILVRLTMEGKKFKRLDMRYDRPIIVLQ